MIYGITFFYDGVSPLKPREIWIEDDNIFIQFSSMNVCIFEIEYLPDVFFGFLKIRSQYWLKEWLGAEE